MFEEGLRLAREHGAENVLDFTLGNPYLNPPPEFLAALAEVVAEEKPKIHGYMQNAGFPETRARVASNLAVELGLPFTSDHVVMTCGAAGALNVIIKSILEPGDEVIVIAPYFVEYGFYIHNHGGVKVVSPADADFLPDLADLEQRIGPKTRAVLTNSPCNPSGRLITADVFARMGDLLRRKSEQYGRTIYLLSDEPYRRLLFDGLRFESPFEHYEATLLATSHSKDLALAGERIGYLAVSPHCIDAQELVSAMTFVNRTLGFINAPAIMQRVLARIEHYEVDVATYQRKRDRLYDALIGMGYEVRRPDGTFFMFPKSPLPDDIAFIQLLKSKLLLVSPGAGFECPGYFRISFCVDDPVIERALPRFAEAIADVRAGWRPE